MNFFKTPQQKDLAKFSGKYCRCGKPLTINNLRYGDKCWSCQMEEKAPLLNIPTQKDWNELDIDLRREVSHEY